MKLGKPVDRRQVISHSKRYCNCIPSLQRARVSLSNGHNLAPILHPEPRAIRIGFEHLGLIIRTYNPIVEVTRRRSPLFLGCAPHEHGGLHPETRPVFFLLSRQVRTARKLGRIESGELRHVRIQRLIFRQNSAYADNDMLTH